MLPLEDSIQSGNALIGHVWILKPWSCLTTPNAPAGAVSWWAGQVPEVGHSSKHHYRQKQKGEDHQPQDAPWKSKPLDQLLEELQEELNTSAVHLFTARQQHQMYCGLSHDHDVPERWLVTAVDFGENFTCFFKNEAQAAHWTQSLVTVDPIVTFCRCPDNDIITKDSFFVHLWWSEARFECYASLHMFGGAVVNGAGTCIPKNYIFFWWLHCPLWMKDLLCWHFFFWNWHWLHKRTSLFFGQVMGRECDGEIGVMKRSAALAIKAGTTVISNSADLHSYCARKLTVQHIHTAGGL